MLLLLALFSLQVFDDCILYANVDVRYVCLVGAHVVDEGDTHKYTQAN